MNSAKIIAFIGTNKFYMKKPMTEISDHIIMDIYYRAFHKSFVF